MKKTNFKSLLLILLLLSLMSCSKEKKDRIVNRGDNQNPDTSGQQVFLSSASKRWFEWRKKWKDEFPTAAWAYFNKYFPSKEAFETYKNAGLNMVQVPIDQEIYAKAAGLRIITGGWKNLYFDKNKKRLDDYIDSANKDISTVGYNLDDEPEPKLYNQLGEAVQRIYFKDNHSNIPIITLLPRWTVHYSRFNMSYDDYVTSFVNKVHPAVMINTIYPNLCNGEDRPGYYENIAFFRRLALENEIGLMGFVNVTQFEGGVCYRAASESDIYWMAYTYLAYGAQGLWYYNYRIGNDSRFGEGLVLHRSGLPNPQSYPYVKALNEDINNLAHILMRLKSIGVFHLQSNPTELPEGTEPFKTNSIKSIAKAEGTDFIISEFKNQDEEKDSSDYIMLVNKRHGKGKLSANLPGEITLTVSSVYNFVYKYNPETGKKVPVNGNSGKYTFTLEGGHGILLRLSKEKL